MENKKLVKILLKDMTDLEEMIAEVKTRGEFDVLEMEILHTRSKGILQLLQLLNGMEPAGVAPKMPVQTTSEKEPGKPVQEIIKEPEVKEETEPQNEIKPVEVPQEKITEEKPMENNQESEEEQEEPVKDEEEAPKETAEETIEEEPREEPVAEKQESDDVELEEEEVLEANQRLGDSFLKGKSVNDILADQNKLEFKLSNRPVVSIQSAIGINDRFQYIRELFDGSAEKFTQTVSDLDKMNNINEAVKYLQRNFKWKKNETSLKFVNLIKRRFANA